MDTPFSFPVNDALCADTAGVPAQAGSPAAGRDSGHPPLVIRGESTWTGYDENTGEQGFVVPAGRGKFRFIPLPALEAHPYCAITDWLNFTFPMGPTTAFLETVFNGLFDALGEQFGPATPRATGIHMYLRSFDLGRTGAKFAYGGNAGTGLFSLSGVACALVPDWSALIAYGRDQLKGKITRWDGAIDDYRGQHGVDEAMTSYLAGEYGTGGNAPSMKQMGNWARSDGSGRSIAIGKRENGKRILVYEKGMQLGAKDHPWVRWEVSFGSTDRIIPWEVLLEPGRYAVGAYPRALSWVQSEASRIATIQKQTQIGYDALVDHASRQYGSLVKLMRQVEGSAENVLKRLERGGLPKRLQHPAMPEPGEWIE